MANPMINASDVEPSHGSAPAGIAVPGYISGFAIESANALATVRPAACPNMSGANIASVQQIKDAPVQDSSRGPTVMKDIADDDSYEVKLEKVLVREFRVNRQTGVRCNVILRAMDEAGAISTKQYLRDRLSNMINNGEVYNTIDGDHFAPVWTPYI